MFYIIYFSPTGGTKKVVDLITQVWDCEKKEINLLKPNDDYENYQLEKDDICVVAVPSFGGRVPAIVTERLGKISANCTKTIGIVTYGNREYDDTLLELKKLLSNRGFHMGAAITAVTEHSIVREIAAGRPDKSDQKQLKNFALQIKEAFDTGNIKEDLLVAGNDPLKKYGVMPMQPKAGDQCTLCGKCAEECPVKAISIENPKETDSEKCISCMRCIAVCPTQDRKLDPMKLEGIRFHLQEVCKERKENQYIL